MDDIIFHLNSAVKEVKCAIEHDDYVTGQRPLFYSGCGGRPSFILPKDILINLLESDFKIADISRLLNVSDKTIRRRLQQYDIEPHRYSSIGDHELLDMITDLKRVYPDVGDHELLDMITDLKRVNPDDGYRSIQALVRERGHKVQRIRIEEGLRLVDPEGVLFRQLFLKVKRINRKTYNVRAPKALWHIDGNHKLIRWKFVVHGAIDGYSRLPVNTNYKAETLLEAFKEAIENWGWPERVRSDKGGENIKVAELMITNKGTRSFITGRSVHNQRIERLWREVWSGCLSLCCYQLFAFMDDQDYLNIDNNIHMFALHLAFKKIIQDHMDQFKESLIRRPPEDRKK